MPQGRFIQIDGLDGSGKSTLLAFARRWAEGRGFKVFDVVEWSIREKRLPTFEEVQDADLLLTAEPTHTGAGELIRTEIIRAGASYNAHFTADAFAVDRGVQYRRLILPFLASKPNGWVIQDRGLMCSLVYQPLQSRQDAVQITIPELLQLEGNRIALERVPDVFVLLTLDAHLAQRRLAKRTEKQDDDRFSMLEFQQTVAERYRSAEVTTPYTSRGTVIHTLDSSLSLEAVAADLIRILDELAAT